MVKELTGCLTMHALVLLLEGAGVVRRAGICLLGVPPSAPRPASCSRSNKERASPRRSLGEGGVGLSAVAVLRCAASHRAAGSARASQPPRSVRCWAGASASCRFARSRDILLADNPCIKWICIGR